MLRGGASSFPERTVISDVERFLNEADAALREADDAACARVAGTYLGELLKGRVRMHTTDGHQDFAAGQAFYWGPGHAPEALEDSEYVDFSPTHEFQRVLDHLTGAAAPADA